MRPILFLAAAALCASCAAPGLGVRAGLTTEAELLARWGRPALEIDHPGGERSLFYPSGPLGLHTYEARVGAAGRVVAVAQVLDDDRFDRIRPGMTRGELLRLIGPPGDVVRFDNLRQTAWDYRYRDTWGYIAVLSVMLDDQGRVAGRVTNRLERERGWM